MSLIDQDRTEWALTVLSFFMVLGFLTFCAGLLFAIARIFNHLTWVP